MREGLVMVPCKSCGNKVPVNDLRRNEQGLFVCHNCLSRKYQDIVIQDVTPEKFKAKPKEEVKPARKVERIDYYCTSCKFKFTRGRDSPSRGCPYCGKENSIQRRETAADLLKEVESMF